MKTLLLPFLLIFTTLSFGQNASISGRITEEDGLPIPGVNILLDENKGTLTDFNGYYEFKNVQPGSYTVKISYLGYENQSASIDLKAGQNKTLEFTLEAANESLQEIEITGRRARTYKNAIAFSGTKTATPIKEIPQAISYVTKEVFADRQAFRVNDVVQNVSGINQFSYYNDYTIRGFRSQQELINGLRVINLFGPQTILANLERVEVIKGPASAIFGNASPGGTLNRVTKKPLAVDRKAINFTSGSFNTLRSTLDFTGPLDENKTLLYRLNLAYENSDSFRDLQEFKSFMVAPSISFLPTDKTRLNFDLVITNFDGKLDRGQPIFGATAGTDLNSTPISFAIGAANDYHKTSVAYGTLSLNHQFTEDFSFNTSYMRYGFEEDLFEHRTSNRFAVDNLGNEIPTLMGMRISAREQKRVNDNISSYFIYNTSTGDVDHKLLLGHDYIQSAIPTGGGGIFTSSAAIYRTRDGGLDRYDPSTPERYFFDEDGNPVPNIPHFNLENPAYLLGYPSDYILNRYEIAPEKYYTNGVYIQDQMEWKNLKVLLGLRQEFYTDILNYKQSDEEERQQEKFLPRLGMVYTLNNNINIYGTYTESFQPQNPNDLTGEQGGPFDPLTGMMYEVGAKSTFFNDRLAVNLALYHIENKNILIPDVETGLLIQRGGEESRGIEVDINGNISKDLSVTANYAYNVAKITESADESLKGQIKENAPKHSGGFFANYQFTENFLDGVNFNLGSSFVSQRNTFERTLQLPAYMVWDSGLSYSVNKVKLALTINNIFDKTHWVGGYSYTRLFPGAPRNFLLSVGYTF